MNKNESKYFNTALLMNDALLLLLQKKDYEYITVKEVCLKAGVHRSTFYLHYESMNDLLTETVETLNKRFFDMFGEKNRSFSLDKATCDECMFITPEYLKPFLGYIKDNKKLWRLICEKGYLFRTEKTFDKMYKSIFCPILAKYGVNEKEQPYVFSYFFKGVLGIITAWVDLDCEKPVDELVSIITDCLSYRTSEKND